MAPDDSPELDPKLKELVQEAVEEVRGEFLRRLQETRDRLEGLVRGAVPEAESEELPEAPATEGEDEAEEEAEPAPPPSHEELLAAVAAIDRSRTQTDILASLLGAVSGSGARAALFLTRPEGLLGWAGNGFGEGDEAFDGHLVEYGEGTPWARLAEGRGSVELEAGECEELCAGLEVAAGASGLLVPLVLRDRLAAALYVDRTDETGAPDAAALQILTYITAQALETLPLRSRAATPTLGWSAAVDDDEPGLGLWEGTPAAVAVGAAAVIEEAHGDEPESEEPALDDEAPAEEPEPADEVPPAEDEWPVAVEPPAFTDDTIGDEAVAEEEPPAGEEPVDAETAAEEPVYEEPAFADEEPTDEEPAEAAAAADETAPEEDLEPTVGDTFEPWAVVEPTADDSEESAAAVEEELAAFDDAGEPAPVEAEQLQDEEPEVEETASEEPTPAETTGFAMESIPAPELEGPDPYDAETAGSQDTGYPTEPSPWPITGGETIPTGEALLEDPADTAADAELADEAMVLEEEEFGEEAEEEQPAAEAAAEAEEPEAEAAGEEVTATDQETDEPRESAETVSSDDEPAADSTQPMTAPVTGAPGSGSQVVPPQDVEGPGWAFSAAGGTSDGSLESRMEEARRLARLLVTEIKLYNEEQVAEGREQGNIYRALKDDIDRSRVIFDERVDEDVREQQDYFRDELVRILAAGNEDVLGD